MSASEHDRDDSPTAWFCVLEQAIRRGNRDRELEARRELAQLGVLVTIDARSVLAAPTSEPPADSLNRPSPEPQR